MPRKHARITIAPGVVQDGDTAIASVSYGTAGAGRRSAFRRFPNPLHGGRPGLSAELRQAIEIWQRSALNDLIEAAPLQPVSGTLGADIDQFVDNLPETKDEHRQYKKDSRTVLAAWKKTPLADRPRHQITAEDLKTQRERWQDAGTANGTIDRRVFRLRALYHRLDTPTKNGPPPNPTDSIGKLPKPEIEHRSIPIRIVRLIIEAQPDAGRAERHGKRPTVNQTKLRLRVMALTGIAGATLRRIRLRDLELHKTPGRVFLRPRRKGKGQEYGAWLDLLPAAVDAFRAFVAAGLIGKSWSRSSMRKSFHVAVRRATEAAREAAKTDPTWIDDLAAMPPRPKPYDLRHSFATEMYRLTGDVRAVSELLQHSELETTKRYTLGAVSQRVTAAVATATAAGSFATPPPAPAAIARPRLVRKAAS